ncbi:MAG: hypothetical protein M3Y35_07610 [Actinomycetota bacterium]|nr:hypothetical protein [Actinomycetota bacterium]
MDQSNEPAQLPPDDDLPLRMFVGAVAVADWEDSRAERSVEWAYIDGLVESVRIVYHRGAEQLLSVKTISGGDLPSRGRTVESRGSEVVAWRAWNTSQRNDDEIGSYTDDLLGQRHATSSALRTAVNTASTTASMALFNGQPCPIEYADVDGLICLTATIDGQMIFSVCNAELFGSIAFRTDGRALFSN